MFKTKILLCLVSLMSLSILAGESDAITFVYSSWPGASSASILRSSGIVDVSEIRSAPEREDAVEIASLDLKTESDAELCRMMGHAGLVSSWRSGRRYYKVHPVNEEHEEKCMLLAEVKRRFDGNSSSEVVPELLTNGWFNALKSFIESLSGGIAEKTIEHYSRSGTIMHHLLTNLNLSSGGFNLLISLLKQKDVRLLTKENDSGETPFEYVVKRVIGVESDCKAGSGVLASLRPAEPSLELDDDASIDDRLKLERRKYAFAHNGMPIELAGTDDKDVLSIAKEVIELAQEDLAYADYIFEFMNSPLYPRNQELTPEIKLQSLVYAVNMVEQNADVAKIVATIIRTLKKLGDIEGLLFSPIQIEEEQWIPVVKILEKACTLNNVDLFRCVARAMPERRIVHTRATVEKYAEALHGFLAEESEDAVKRCIDRMKWLISSRFCGFASAEETKRALLEKIGTLADHQEQYQVLQQHIQKCYQDKKDQENILHQMIEVIEHVYSDKDPAEFDKCGFWLKQLMKYLLLGQLPDAKLTKKLAFHLCLKHDGPHYKAAKEKLNTYSKLHQIYFGMAKQQIINDVMISLLVIDPNHERIMSKLGREVKGGADGDPAYYFDAETCTIQEKKCASFEEILECAKSLKEALDRLSPAVQKAINKLIESGRKKLSQLEESELPSAGGGASSSSSSSACSASSAAE